MTWTQHSFAARQWLSTQPGASSLLTASPPVEARSAGEGRGLGLFTTRAVPAYTVLMSEPPAILMHPKDDLPQLWDQFSALPQSQQDKVAALVGHGNIEKDAILCERLLQRGVSPDDVDLQIQVGHIIQTNTFTVDLDLEKETGYRALFCDIARMNHACAPNAHVSYYVPTEADPRGRMVVHALKDFQPGEEVLISYFSILLPRSERQTKSQKWGFTCVCSACDESAPSQPEAEKMRNAFRDFKAKQAALMADPRPSIKDIRALIQKGEKLITRVADDPSLRPALPDQYDQLGMLEAKALIVQGKENQRQDVLKQLEKAVICDAKITGLESPASKRRLLKWERFSNRNGEFKKAVLERDGEGRIVVRWSGG